MRKNGLHIGSIPLPHYVANMAWWPDKADLPCQTLRWRICETGFRVGSGDQ